MKNEQENKQNLSNGHDNTIGGAQNNKPDAEATNDTGFAGTTNAISEEHNEQNGYKMAVEDTMIGYDGHEEQLDMDYLDDKDKLRTGNSGTDDNS